MSKLNCLFNKVKTTTKYLVTPVSGGNDIIPDC